ncbi:MAG: type II toxin-antitoxin system VapC family toxin [Gemmatimonadaceae bacterium]
MDLERAKTLLLGATRLSARDAIHAAVMQRHDVERILTFDTGFDSIPGLDRLG